MFKKFIPYCHATSIYDINIQFFLDIGVKNILLDLDNTLDSYKLYKPTNRAIELIKRFQNNGISPIVISNNKGKRVSSYANALKIPYINSAMKPFAKKITQYIEHNHIDKNTLVFVGDQMMTDVLACHNAGIRCILTEKIVKEDQFTTHINRIFDRVIRRHLRRKGKLIDWRELWQKQ